MPKLTNSVPKYRKHKRSGQAVVTLNGRDFYLGPWGTNESREKYDRLISEWTGGGRQPLATDDTGLTVGECVSRYWAEHVKPRFEPLKVATAQSDNLRAALRPLLALYDSELASKFGPNALRIVRDKMVESGLARMTINRRTKYIVAMFKWLASHELVSVTVYHKLQTVEALRRGHTRRPAEPERVEPVDDARVEAVVPHLPAVVAEMVKLQRLMGCRPGEVCAIRPCDVDRSGDVWIYRPESHKTAHLGRDRLADISRLEAPHAALAGRSFGASPRFNLECLLH